MKRVIKRAFSAVGLQVRWKPRASSQFIGDGRHSSGIPELRDSPLEALHYFRGGSKAAFLCPIRDIGLLNGTKFGEVGWNPFSQTAAEILQNPQISDAETTLAKFYQNWQPADAASAVLGLAESCAGLRGLPPHLFYLVPWRSLSVEEIEHEVQHWYRKDLIEHGFPPFEIDVSGFKHNGPVRPELLNAEVARLRSIVPILQNRGYDRRFGDVSVWLLKRGDDLRFINRGGFHRTAAYDALGHKVIPAKLVEPGIFDVDDVDFWPQVRAGRWTREEALRYVDHLFDFDSKGWADQFNFSSHPLGQSSHSRSS